MRSTERNGAPVSLLSRAAAIVGAFDDRDPVLSLGELARRTGLPKSTVHRITAELVTLRVLERQESGPSGEGYRLGMWLFERGELVPQHRSLSDAALPLMEDLREVTRQRIHLAVLDGVDVVYVEILGTGGLEVVSRTGGRLPAHATGVGKAMLAYSSAATVQARIDAGLPRLTPRTISTPGGLVRELRKIRSIGMALDLEEAQLGVSCVAAPVFGADRKVAAALSVTGVTGSVDPGTLGPAVRTAAFTLSRLLRESGL
ncbi:MAG TPA: IclR family transcriptional regulator [Ornithinibacter sp.]|nr:IclR family transcriptional regulator [Ornithinibacter sp.]